MLPFDVDELRELGLPVWARYIRARADPTRTWWASSTSRSRSEASPSGPATSSCSMRTARSSSNVERVDDVLDAARQRAEAEREKRAKLEAGALSYDLDGLRERVEGASV